MNWINITTRQPQHFQTVVLLRVYYCLLGDKIISTTIGTPYIADILGNTLEDVITYCGNEKTISRVTHWLPIPDHTNLPIPTKIK